MIDFHTHILPGIDDGAKDVSVSAAMLEMEKEQGVNEIVLTPHYYGKFYSPRDFVRRRAAAYEKLLAVAAGEFFFTLGAEIHFSDTLSVNAECRKLAIGDTRYALVELPFGEKVVRLVAYAASVFYGRNGTYPGDRAYLPLSAAQKKSRSAASSGGNGVFAAGERLGVLR